MRPIPDLSAYYHSSIYPTFWAFVEKLEDQKARAAIKAQIEADKRERAEKAAREKALREGKAIPTSSSPVPTIVPKANTGMKSSENPETRLQIRLATGGTPMTKTFPSDNSMYSNFLFHVGLAPEMNEWTDWNQL